MPYGLVNAPSVFQDFMHEVLREFLHHFVIVYIDDILIYSRSLAEHRHHVAEVLQQLRKYQLYLKAEKCIFHQPSVHFLGYIISNGGICMDKGKVEAITSWPRPTTIKELQRFLGFSNFYRRFIANYSSITSPLTDLLKGGNKSLSWDLSEGNIHYRTSPGSSEPQSALYCRGGCLNHWSRCGSFTAAGETLQAPSMCLLLKETQPGGEEL